MYEKIVYIDELIILRRSDLLLYFIEILFLKDIFLLLCMNIVEEFFSLYSFKIGLIIDDVVFLR